MIKNSKEALKQEGHSNSNNDEKEKASSSNSLASQWSRLKDPRIVRVSRAFGGKDRHSKVCTIRGLRDRRVRLSVPTAIQLYDLQDRLGLNQPSKVVDWLLNVAKHEIDELPPLPNFPSHGNFNFGFPSINIEANTNTSQLNQQLLNINRNIPWEGSTSSQNSMWKLKPKEVTQEMVIDNKANYWMNRIEEDDDNNNKHGSNEGNNSSDHVLSSNNNNLLLQRTNHQASFLGLLNTMPSMGNYQWGGNSNVDVNSQLGNHIGFTNQTNVNVVTSLPPMLSLSTGNSQMMPYFPSHHHVNAMEMDNHHHQRQINHHNYQMLSSSSQNPLNNSLNNPSFNLAMMIPKENPSNKDQDFTPK
ncbi:uncharacterized protein [Cicer arietinum]|uniref:Transcription factor TCP5-like n=1 Tax=Cicer arietinum TaxID=3827 RepID=A0A1S2Y699_CICAR|nr:transcription factor TCP5-like [Cicer arietinum]